MLLGLDRHSRRWLWFRCWLIQGRAAESCCTTHDTTEHTAHGRLFIDTFQRWPVGGQVGQHLLLGALGQFFERLDTTAGQHTVDQPLGHVDAVGASHLSVNISNAHGSTDTGASSTEQAGQTTRQQCQSCLAGCQVARLLNGLRSLLTRRRNPFACTGTECPGQSRRCAKGSCTECYTLARNTTGSHRRDAFDHLANGIRRVLCNGFYRGTEAFSVGNFLLLRSGLWRHFSVEHCSCFLRIHAVTGKPGRNRATRGDIAQTGSSVEQVVSTTTNTAADIRDPLAECAAGLGWLIGLGVVRPWRSIVRRGWLRRCSSLRRVSRVVFPRHTGH
ncbi:hypothetical protein D3C75_546960 [compost metagenome]